MAIKLPFGIQVSRAPTPYAMIPGAEPDVPFNPKDNAEDREPVGVTGTQYYSGFLDSEEYNSDLQGLRAVTVYDAMGRSDGTCKAMLRSIALPIQGAIPHMTSASEDPKDVHIAQAMEYGLTHMKKMTWESFIRQVTKGTIQFGHAVFEPVWVTPKGQVNLVECDGEKVIMPYKMAPRLQKSLYQWDIDRNGDLKGINQRTWVANRDPNVSYPEGPNAQLISTAGAWQYIYIQAERLLLFTLEQEGANFTGESIFRSAYKHYYFKDVCLRIWALQAERQAVGVPYAILKQAITPAREKAAAAVLRTLHAHEKMYMLFNENDLADYKNIGMAPIGILDMKAATAKSLIDQVNYHDRQMALSILADFLMLGAGMSGNANVMHRDKSSLFFNALRGIVSLLEGVIQQFIEQIVDLNWSGVTKYPQFSFTSLETKDFDKLGRSLANLAGAQLITPTPEVEATLREMMDLPPLPEDETGHPIYPEGTHEAPPAVADPGAPAKPGEPKQPPGEPGMPPEPGDTSQELSVSQKQILQQFVDEYLDEVGVA